MLGQFTRTLRFILAHPMNRGRPIAAIWRFLHWQLISRVRDETVVDWIGGAKLAVRRGMTGATGNIYCGLHEYVDMSFVLAVLRAGDLFVDGGANVGSYSVLASRVCGARTIAFEPDPETVQHLRRNIDLNGISEKVTVVEAAIGPQPGQVSFTVGLDTVNRIAQPAEDHVRQVSMVTLDSVLGDRQPLLMKLDLEGFELEALRGCETTLAYRPPSAIISENADPGVVELLARYGFEQRTYRPAMRRLEVPSGAAQSQNTIFVRPGSEIEARLAA